MAAFTMMGLSLLLAGVGTATKVVGDIKAGNAANKAGLAAGKASEAAGLAARDASLAQQRASESQAGLADFNAQVADLQGADAIARGREEESRFRTSVRGLIGSQRAGFAGANIDVGFGSAVDVQADSAFLGERDAQSIKLNAAREAWGFRQTAEDSRQRGAILRQEGAFYAKAGVVEQETARLQAEAQREQGKAAQHASRTNTVGTLIGAGSSLLMQRYGMKH